MSYLICLYVYYHGNNLHAFGFDPGKTPVGELNTGLNRSNSAEDFKGLLPDDVVRSMVAAEKSSGPSYEEIFRQALAEAQDSTKRMLNSSLNISTGNATTGDFDLEDDDGGVGMDFFDEMNGLGSYSKNNSPWPF